MNNNHRDPSRRELDEARLTAYALGQLHEAEKAAVESQLAGLGAEDAERVRRTVDQIRLLGGHVRTAAGQDPGPEPSSSLRTAVERRLNELEGSPMAKTQDAALAGRRPWYRRHSIALLAAACLVIAAVPICWMIADSLWQAHRHELALLGDATSTEKAIAKYETEERGYHGDEASPGAYEEGPVGSRQSQGLQEESRRARTKAGDEMAGLQSSPERTAVGQLAAEGEQPSGELAPEGEKFRRFLTEKQNERERRHTRLDGAPAGAGMGMGEYKDSAGKPAQPGSPLYGGGMPGMGPVSAPPGHLAGHGHGPYDEKYEYGGYKESAQSMYGAAYEGVGDMYGSGMMPGSGYHSGMPRGEPGQVADGRSNTMHVAGAPMGFDQARGPQGSVSSDLYMGEKHALDGRSQSMPVPGAGDVATAGRGYGYGTSGYRGGVATGSADGSVQFLNETVNGRVYRRSITPEGTGKGGRVNPTWGVPGTEQYDPIVENDFLPVRKHPLSTFSIDVDTASYANVRRFINEGRLPPPSAVRIEEMVNYFQYDYPPPEDSEPFAVHLEVARCPWNGKHRLVRIGLKGQEIHRDQRGPTNLVFLLDVSGSMRDENKLPLVKKAMRLLVDQLNEDDRVAIVTYASSAAMVLESTCGDNKPTILDAIDALQAGGSTHGSAGIQLAYDHASLHFEQEGTNRVILATDGDLNVGITEDDDLVRLIKQKAKTGVFLTVLGFGTGNLKDSKLEKLADKGNGAYAYVDNLREAWRVLVEQISGSLVTIAKDVKIQIEFNPAEVASYRLIGYENRVLAARDFDNDKKDAGEIGAGHTVTALYEIVPAGRERELRVADRPLKYQRPAEEPPTELTEAAESGELLTLRLCYKKPDGDKSKLVEHVAEDSGKRLGEASADFQFAAAVAAFGMVLRNSQYQGEATLAAVEEYALSGVGDDPGGYRTEFVDLVRRARQMAGQDP